MIPATATYPTRLNREFGRKRWGDAGYAAEELVAELAHPIRDASGQGAPFGVC